METHGIIVLNPRQWMSCFCASGNKGRFFLYLARESHELAREGGGERRVCGNKGNDDRDRWGESAISEKCEEKKEGVEGGGEVLLLMMMMNDDTDHGGGCEILDSSFLAVF